MSTTACDPVLNRRPVVVPSGLSSFPCSSRTKAVTVAAHQEAVVRVISLMHERYMEPLSLTIMAETALLSPYHLNRVFRHVTGIPPARFLAALRLAAAKQLLLTTSKSVTDVCFGVGYSSLGSFTTRFTRSVGLPPQQFRRFVGSGGPATPTYRAPGDRQRPGGARGAVMGQVSTTGVWTAPVFVGLYTTPLPQGRPSACTLLTRPGSYRLDAVGEGTYFVVAASFHGCLGAESRLGEASWVGIHPAPIHVGAGVDRYRADIVLRERRVTDPPIVSALPDPVGLGADDMRSVDGGGSDAIVTADRRSSRAIWS